MLAATLLVYATRLTRVERFEGQGSASTTCQGTPTFTFDYPEGVCSAPTDEQLAKMGITSASANPDPCTRGTSQTLTGARTGGACLECTAGTLKNY